jgi:hypothetical protein
MAYSAGGLFLAGTLNGHSVDLRLNDVYERMNWRIWKYISPTISAKHRASLREYRGAHGGEESYSPGHRCQGSR